MLYIRQHTRFTTGGGSKRMILNAYFSDPIYEITFFFLVESASVRNVKLIVTDCLWVLFGLCEFLYACKSVPILSLCKK